MNLFDATELVFVITTTMVCLINGLTKKSLKTEYRIGLIIFGIFGVVVAGFIIGEAH